MEYLSFDAPRQALRVGRGQKMTNSLRSGGFGWVAVLAAAGCGAMLARTPDEFPLRAGTKWVYRGTVTTDDGKRDVTFTIEVEKAAMKDGALAAQMKGDLADLALWEPSKKPSIRFVTRRGGRYFRAARAEDPGELFLILPLTEGQRICPEGEGQYSKLCWAVEEIASARVEAKGAPAEERTRYRLAQRDKTGARVLDFVPGVGITAYQYHHNGTVSDVDVKLAEVVLK